MKTLLVVSVLYCSFAIQAQIKKSPNTSTDMKNVNTVQHQGRTYKTVKIGDQVWMAENLRARKFRNGDLIDEINVPDDYNDIDSWLKLDNDAPAWHHPTNDPNRGKKVGFFYNQEVVVDERNICPQGWHIPRLLEWDKLIETLAKTKKNNDLAPELILNIDEWNTKNGIYYEHWKKSENASGFNAVKTWGEQTNPYTGVFVHWCYAHWWTQTICDETTNERYRFELSSELDGGYVSWSIIRNNLKVTTGSTGTPNTRGTMSIRCIKNKK